MVNGILYDTTGDRLEASDCRTGEVLWSWQDAKSMAGERRLTPPAVANGRVWAGTWDGRVMSWDAWTGAVRWAVKVGAPCHWQPVASEGWIFAGLEDGSLIGFNTGDPLDTGWPMWVAAAAITDCPSAIRNAEIANPDPATTIGGQRATRKRRNGEFRWLSQLLFLSLVSAQPKGAACAAPSGCVGGLEKGL